MVGRRRRSNTKRKIGRDRVHHGGRGTEFGRDRKEEVESISIDDEEKEDVSEDYEYYEKSPLPPIVPVPTDCATSNYPRLIHDQKTWKFLQEAFLVDRPVIKRPPPLDGFKYAIVVKDDGMRGRSVYAAEPIPAGASVWRSVHLANFRTPQQWLTFLRRIEHHDLICDALLWAYVSKGERMVSLALDEGSFINHGNTKDEINLDKDCMALRDIDVGEELLENYTEFIGYKELKWFDRIRGDAWQEQTAKKSVGNNLLAESTDTYNIFGAPKQNTDGSYSKQHQIRHHNHHNQQQHVTINKNHHHRHPINGRNNNINDQYPLMNQIEEYYIMYEKDPNGAATVITKILFPVLFVLIACAYVLKRKFPAHFFKKEKEGI